MLPNKCPDLSSVAHVMLSSQLLLWHCRSSHVVAWWDMYNASVCLWAVGLFVRHLRRSLYPAHCVHMACSVLPLNFRFVWNTLLKMRQNVRWLATGEPRCSVSALYSKNNSATVPGAKSLIGPENVPGPASTLSVGAVATKENAAAATARSSCSSTSSAVMCSALRDDACFAASTLLSKT